MKKLTYLQCEQISGSYCPMPMVVVSTLIGLGCYVLGSEYPTAQGMILCGFIGAAIPVAFILFE
jgi:hypothetical protein